MGRGGGDLRHTICEYAFESELGEFNDIPGDIEKEWSVGRVSSARRCEEWG